MKQKNIILALFSLSVLVLISISVNAMPIPTSIYGKISNAEDPIVSVQIYNDTDFLFNISKQADDDGWFVIVFSTDGIKMVNLTFNIISEDMNIYKKIYQNIETGSKLQINIEFKKEDLNLEPKEENSIEKQGNGGGTTEPKKDDIEIPIIKDKPTKFESDNLGITEPDTNESIQSKNESMMPDKKTNITTQEKFENLEEMEEKSTKKLNLLLIILAVALVVLLFIMIKIDHFKKNEENN